MQKGNDINKASAASGFFMGMRPYLITAITIVISYILFALVLDADERAVRAVMLSGAGLCFAFLLIKRIPKRNGISAETVVTVLIIAGIIMRVGYMLYTPFAVRDYDVSTLEGSGHFAYMYRLYSQGALPASYDYQFYHPPFQHFVQALVVRVFALFQPQRELIAVFEAAKIVPCFASCALLWVCRSLCGELGMPRRARTAAIAVLAFHPAFYQLSARVNNDALTVFFFMVSVLYTVRWYRAPGMKHMLLIALSIGLSMMTKLSGGLAALFTAPVFLAVLIKGWRERRTKKLIGQFAAFAAVCAPLGLWYSVRNYVLFGQPFGYVVRFADNSWLYCGDQSAVSRFLSFPLEQLFHPLYCSSGEDCNIWLYVLKSSLFGEFSFQGNDWAAAALVILNLALILASLAAMVYVLTRCREAEGFARWGLLWIWLVQMGAFLIFNIRYPFGCTMDFRYIMPAAVTGALYLGIALDALRAKRKAAANVIYWAGCLLIALFCAASVLFYAL